MATCRAFRCSFSCLLTSWFLSPEAGRGYGALVPPARAMGLWSHLTAGLVALGERHAFLTSAS